ncbi:hypothetical protein [Hyphomicrobium sp. 99]|uniref:hypothetical protein n=1 Tax=Hyphomicrobium sp. 99 TaxID=1163419 RepID=UPI0005F85865|nr:hypothetical protein [Hyphomicrobium sp. 99]
MILRGLAVFVGCSIIGAMAHVAILSTGGYASPTAPLQIAVALGLCTGSVCVGVSLRDGSWMLAIVLAIALLCGELYAVLTTSEITIAARDAIAGPVRDAEQARLAARARLDAAEEAKLAADGAAISEAAKPGCRRECRILLEGAKADAQRDLEAARSALAAIPPPRSAAPLADRLHVDDATLDLVAAALRSLAINGLGAALIAFGARTGKPALCIRRTPAKAEEVDVDEMRLPFPAPTAKEHAFRFARDVLEPADIDTPVVKLHGAYVEWCSAVGQEPFPVRTIGLELAELFKRTGIEIVEIAGTRFIAKARLNAQRLLAPTVNV